MMFKLFEFKNGEFTTLPDIKSKKIKGFIIGSVLLLIVVSLSAWLEIEEKELWKIYNLIIQQFDLKQDAPKIEREPEIEARVELEVDKAIRDYEKLTGDDGRVRITPPRYIEEPINNETCYSKECRALGPPMRLCSPWWDGCPSGTEDLTKDEF